MTAPARSQRLDGPLDAAPGPPPRGILGTPRRAAWFAALCIVLALAFGLAKLLRQRASPPDWAIGDNVYQGFVAIDGFAQRAEYVHRWLLEPDAGNLERITESLRYGLHPTSLVVPSLTAVIACTGLSIPWSYVAATWLLFFACLWMAVRLARQLGGDRAERAPLAVAVIVLLASHCLSLRTVGLLYQDWAVALAYLGAASASLVWARQPSAATTGKVVAWLVFGFFGKISFTPALLLPFLCAWAERRGARAFAVAAAIALLPVLAVVLFVLQLGSLSVLSRDTEHLLSTNEMSWSRVGAFVLETGLLLQFLPLLLYGERRALSREAMAMLLAAGCAFAASALWKLPLIPRLWLPVLVLAVPVAAVAMARPERRRWLVPFALGNWAIGALGLWLA